MFLYIIMFTVVVLLLLKIRIRVFYAKPILTFKLFATLASLNMHLILNTEKTKKHRQ